MRRTLTNVVGRITFHLRTPFLACANSHSALITPIKTAQQNVYRKFMICCHILCTFLRNWKCKLKMRILGVTVRVIFRLSRCCLVFYPELILVIFVLFLLRKFYPVLHNFHYNVRVQDL